MRQGDEQQDCDVCDHHRVSNPGRPSSRGTRPVSCVVAVLPPDCSAAVTDSDFAQRRPPSGDGIHRRGLLLRKAVMFTLMPAPTDISAARSPSVVHGYFTQAFGIHENMSSQHLLGSRAQVQREPNGNSAEVSMNAVDNWQSDAQIALEHCCVLLFVDARQLRDDRSPWGYPSATWRHFK